MYFLFWAEYNTVIGWALADCDVYHFLQIAVVGDDMESIAEEVKLFASSFDFVLTTGGVGPTHDDVTLEGTLSN